MILVGVGLVGTVVALGTLFSEAKQMSIFGQSVRSSDFSLQKLDSMAKGKNQLDVVVTLRNDDAASARSANATVQVLSVAGDVIAEQTQSTGPVGPGGSATLTYTFATAGIVAAFDSLQVVLVQN